MSFFTQGERPPQNGLSRFQRQARAAAAAAPIAAAAPVAAPVAPVNRGANRGANLPLPILAPVPGIEIPRAAHQYTNMHVNTPPEQDSDGDVIMYNAEPAAAAAELDGPPPVLRLERQGGRRKHKTRHNKKQRKHRQHRRTRKY